VKRELEKVYNERGSEEYIEYIRARGN